MSGQKHPVCGSPAEQKAHAMPGEEAEYGEAACAGMEWCDPEGSRTADTA